jgi:hypothetical protein
MLNKLSRSLDVLLRQKQSLDAKVERLAQTERRLIETLSRALSGVGYQIVPVNGSTAAPDGAGRRPAPKRLRCPECDRRFSHPLPMARHMKATHHKTLAQPKEPKASKPPKARQARKARKTTARKRAS